MDIFLQLSPAGHSQVYSYQLANCIVYINQLVVGWDLFEVSRPGEVGWPIFPATDLPFPALVYADRGWVGHANRFVTCHVGPAGYKLTIEPDIAFVVAGNGQHIEQQAGSNPLVVQDTSGAALILALALQGTFCLHASAVLVGGQVLAFVGESGRGKSTLAAYLAGQLGWQLIGDDILPFADGLVFPHFPQLKLPKQWAINLPFSLPLGGVYLLAECPAGTPPTCELLSVAQAGRHLLRHTVASRLFGPSLLGQHFQFCLDWAAKIPVYRLTYPRQMSILPQLATLLVPKQ